MARDDGLPDARAKPRRRAGRRHYAVSNFYPGYGEGNASLDRIEPVSAVRMQRILPRYDLSTARTRTSGLGPPLLETPVSVELRGEDDSPLRVPRDRDESGFRDSAGSRREASPRDNARPDESRHGERKAGNPGEDDDTTFTDDSIGTIVDIEV